jgi:hypothetical protein
MLVRFRKISLFMAYTVATIPLWHYISEAHILLLMTAVVIFAYLNVVLSSVETAQAILSSEKAKTTLPRWLPTKPKYEKWWLIVRHTLKWQLLLVPAKMGLALGFTQWLYLSNRILFFPVRLFDRIYNYYGTAWTENPCPQWETILIATVSIIVCSLIETILTASIITLASHQQTSFGKRGAWALLLRLAIALSFVGSTVLIYSFDKQNWYPCIIIDPEHSLNLSQDCMVTKISETVYLSLMSSFDQNVLLSANIMRPVTATFAANYEGFRWDNHLFVLRQCVAGILGILLYIGTTWTILWFVEDEPHSSVL